MSSPSVNLLISLALVLLDLEADFLGIASLITCFQCRGLNEGLNRSLMTGRVDCGLQDICISCLLTNITV